MGEKVLESQVLGIRSSSGPPVSTSASLVLLFINNVT